MEKLKKTQKNGPTGVQALLKKASEVCSSLGSSSVDSSSQRVPRTVWFEISCRQGELSSPSPGQNLVSDATFRSVLEMEMGSLGRATADTRSRSLVVVRILHFRMVGCFSPTGAGVRPEVKHPVEMGNVS